MSLFQTAALLGSLVASVAAHGYVQGVVVAGEFYEGYSPSFQYMDPPPIVIGWSVPEDLGNGFIDPNNYTTENIICHLDATPAGASAKIAAGDIVELQWTPWPDSHHGPVLDYLAKCPGSCTDVDKTKLEFFKISAGGLINDATPPGTWATDQLIANNNSWTVTIPKSIAPGNYVLRHEIIALHSAEEADGAQNYPQCVNLEIAGSGTDEPAGTLGEKLYTSKEPGILIDIYTSLSTYIIPGPSLISGAVSMKQTEVKITATAPAASGQSTVYGASTTAETSSAAAMSSSTAAAASSSGAPSTSTPTSTTTQAKPTTKATSKAKPTTKATSTAETTTKATSEAKPTTKATSKAKPSSYKQHTSKVSKPTSAPSPSSTAVSPASTSTSTKCKQTITVTSSSATSVAAASASSSASASAPTVSGPAPYSALSSLVSALPSSALSKTVPALPTSTGGAASPTGGSGGYPGGMPPSMAPPKGTTLKELLEWLAYMMEHIFRKEAKHARDLNTR